MNNVSNVLFTITYFHWTRGVPILSSLNLHLKSIFFRHVFFIFHVTVHLSWLYVLYDVSTYKILLFLRLITRALTTVKLLCLSSSSYYYYYYYCYYYSYLDDDGWWSSYQHMFDITRIILKYSLIPLMDITF